MSKKALLLFILLLAFWLVISAQIDLEHILVGSFIAVLLVWFWHDMESRLPGQFSWKGFLHLLYCLALLVGYVITANLAVAKTLLSRKKEINPVFIEMNTHIQSNWIRVLLALCITITPGTVTVDLDPETGWFIVHALTEDMGRDLLYWRLIDRIGELENYLHRS